MMRGHFTYKSVREDESETGFTLIEMIVTTSISIIIASVLISSFAKFKVDLNQVSTQVGDAVHQAQSYALAGSVLSTGAYTGSYTCGYGVHFTATTYTVFAAATPAPTTGCASVPTTYSGSTTILSSTALPSTLSVSPVPPDIFFQPPIPKTYINGVNSGTATINLITSGASCPSSNCRTVTVTSAGLIQ